MMLKETSTVPESIRRELLEKELIVLRGRLASEYCRRRNAEDEKLILGVMAAVLFIVLVLLGVDAFPSSASSR